MATLKPTYGSIQEVPEEFREAYEERDGQAQFVGKDFDFKAPSEVNTLREAKKAGFDKYHSLKARFEGLDDDFDVSKWKDTQKELDILRAKLKSNGVDSDEIESIVSTRVERETKSFRDTIEQLNGKLSDLSNYKLKTERKAQVTSVLKKHVNESLIKDAEIIISEAVSPSEDGTFISNGKFGFEKGLTIEEMVKESLKSKPHWKKETDPGHGGNGSRGNKSKSDVELFKELVAKQQRNERLTSQEKQTLDKLVLAFRQ